MTDANRFAIGLMNATFIAIPLWGAVIYGATYAFGLLCMGGQP